MPTSVRKAILAVVLVLAGARGQAATRETYDVWDLDFDWALSLYGSSNGTSFYPCELMHFDTERRIISITLAEDPSWLSRGLVYLTIRDADDQRIANTNVLIAMVDRSTVENLRPGLYPRPNRVSGEIFRMGEWERMHGRKLQIVTDHRIYEAPAAALPKALENLKACQRERELRLQGKWVDSGWQTYHR